ncbi:MAG: sulfide-dependent adenosine diphosphate thiazole synthase, partial [candidate division WOR-3 bacterium]
LIREEKFCGVVINWTSVEEAHLHVDPLTVRSQYVIDASGHQAEVVRIVEKKIGQRLFTPTGGIIGEGPMWAETGERTILENTKEVYHNLFVCGMAANTVFGGPRMGPIFGGMFLSGRKVAQLIKERRKIS